MSDMPPEIGHLDWEVDITELPPVFHSQEAIESDSALNRTVLELMMLDGQVTDESEMHAAIARALEEVWDVDLVGYLLGMVATLAEKAQYTKDQLARRVLEKEIT